MADRDAILTHLDDLLDVAAFDDYGPNGLQVPGAREIDTVATGVSAGLELVERATREGAQLLLCHHGLFWEGQPRALTHTMASRLRALLERDVSLAAYHLPLDAHPELGNNALLADALEVIDREPFATHRGKAIGVRGRLGEEGLSLDELVQRVARTCGGRAPLVFAGGPTRVSTIGIVSGGAARTVSEAIGLGLDAFLTGEPTESVMSDALEGGIHFLAAGHYATETHGIRALGEHVADRFGVRHVFIDVPNPV